MLGMLEENDRQQTHHTQTDRGLQPMKSSRTDGGFAVHERGMRKSCDGCRRIKRKCDGDKPCG